VGFLTTHVLDTALGCPAAGLHIELYRIDGARERVAAAVTNADGRCEQALLPVELFVSGTYELLFFAGDYLRRHHVHLPTPLFLDEIPIRFGISDVQAHYHVPLLLSPYGYSTYRGS